MKQRPEYAWLYNVSNNVTKQSVKDACDAYKKWFTSIKGKSDLKVNKPIFKSKNKTKPSFYNDNFNLRVKTKKVLIEKVGWVKTSEQIPINTKYHNPRISFDNKYWYISVGIEKDISPQKLTNETLGIDIGIKNLATLSTGKFYENINKKISIKNLEKKLKRLQRQVSRKYDMNKDGKKFVKTSNIRKLENKIRLIHRKLANIRQNYLHQTTTKIVKTKPSKIVVEKLNVKGEICTFFENAKNIVCAIFSAIGQFFADAWGRICENFTQAGEDLCAIGNAIGAGLSAIWNGICSTAKWLWDTIVNTVVGIWNGLISSASKIFEDIKATIVGIWDGISSKASEIWGGIESTIKGIWNSIKDIFDKVTGFFGGGAKAASVSVSQESINVEDLTRTYNLNHNFKAFENFSPGELNANVSVSAPAPNVYVLLDGSEIATKSFTALDNLINSKVIINKSKLSGAM